MAKGYFASRSSKNFLSKSTSRYGSREPVKIVQRLPVEQSQCDVVRKTLSRIFNKTERK